MAHVFRGCSGLITADCASPKQLVERSGWPIEVRLDAGNGKGKGLFATQARAVKSCRLKVARRCLPLVVAHYDAVSFLSWRAVARVCSRCLRYVGSVEAQIAARLLPGGDAEGAAPVA